MKAGTNQYGKAIRTSWQNGDINNIKEKLASTITGGIQQHFNKEAFALEVVNESIDEGKQLTYLPIPENNADNSSVQLGLFDIAPAANIHRHLHI